MTEAERKVIRTLSSATVYSSLDTIKKHHEADMGHLWTVEVSFQDNRAAIDFQMAIDDVLQHPDPDPVVWVREIDAGTDNACWAICAPGDQGARPARVSF